MKNLREPEPPVLLFAILWLLAMTTFVYVFFRWAPTFSTLFK